MMQLWKNKKFMKWLNYNCIILILGTSIILNIIYLPKYFKAQNHQQQAFSAIEIKALNQTVSNTQTIFDTTYVSTNKTLGTLLNACQNSYQLMNTIYGNMLVAVKDPQTDSWLTSHNNDKTAWFIEKWDETKKSFDNTKVGIDETYLNNNDQYQLVFKNY